MIPNRRSSDFFRSALLGLALVAAPLTFAQNVVLHLRNGDRLAGTILRETTNQVTISNAWIKELAVPLAQIERRELVPPATNAPANNSPPATLPPPVGKPGVMNTNTAAAKAAASPAVTNTFWSRWKGEIALGADLIYGATDQQIYHGHAKFTYAQPYQRDPKEFFREVLSLDAEYGKTAGVLSANRFYGSSKTDYDLDRRMYLYNLGGAGYDKIRLIDLRYEEGPGMGYHWLTQSNLVVNLEFGANYQEEYRGDGTTSRNFFYRLAENSTWKINKQLSFIEKFEFFPEATDLNHFRSRLEATLSYALLQNLSLNLSALDLYDTRPAAGVPRNEFQLRTSVGIKF